MGYANHYGASMKQLDKAQIEALIKRISTTGKKLDDDIQQAGLGCLNHIEQHGDITLFNRLYLALPAGARKSALTAWAIEFGRVLPNTGDNKKEAPFVYSRDKATDMAGAASNPWYNFAPDKAPDEVFDIGKALTALLAKAGKAKSVSDVKLLEQLQGVQLAIAA